MMDEKLLTILKNRFSNSNDLHPGLSWLNVEQYIKHHPPLIEALQFMEETNGEPDVVLLKDKYYYVDTSLESPSKRRSLCYDQKALDSRKKNKPDGHVMQAIEKYNFSLMGEVEYKMFQDIFPFDLKTSSWIHTPGKIREQGGALFCERRYDHVFTFHNGASSYYASRGYRVYIKLDII